MSDTQGAQDRWPGQAGYRPGAYKTIGDLAEVWMSDPSPVMAQYARTFELTSSEVVRRCDWVGGERVEDVELASRLVSPGRGRRALR